MPQNLEYDVLKQEAAKRFEIPVSEVTPEQRRLMKTILFSEIKKFYSEIQVCLV
jgi:DNA polymerase I-like protein with 3'-5' exonuclease and polymerase domains